MEVAAFLMIACAKEKSVGKKASVISDVCNRILLIEDFKWKFTIGVFSGESNQLYVQ